MSGEAHFHLNGVLINIYVVIVLLENPCELHQRPFQKNKSGAP